jgi:Tfp pilus assembly protein PilE
MYSHSRSKIAGFTLVELMVSLGFFALLATMMYGTFNLIQNQVMAVGADNGLNDKGQRILTFMEEDIRMIGFLLGPDARIPYCTGSTTPPANPNVIAYTSGSNASPYDTLTFLTSQPVTIAESPATCMTGQKDKDDVARIDYFLTSIGETTEGSTQIKVDAGASCYSDIAISDPYDVVDNGRSLITFDSLRLSAAAIAGSAPQVYYSLSSLGVLLTVSEAGGLQQNIPDNSTVYGVRQYQYLVDTTAGKRNLRRIGWDKNCSSGADVSVDLVETVNANTGGGIDGLRFEFTSIDTLTNTLVTQSALPTSLTELKSITIWLLVRADKPDPALKNPATSYVLGTTATKFTLPFNDNYRRVLLKKTVEVKNLASIS